MPGDPLASDMFVIALDPLLKLLNAGLMFHAVGSLVRACADDIGCFIANARTLPKLASSFRITQRASGLMPNPKECKLVPVSCQGDDPIKRMEEFLVSYVPTWAEFKVTRSAMYLGVFLGPGTTDESSSQNGSMQASALL